MKQEWFARLMELFRSAYRKVADKIASLIAELIGRGKTPQQAVQEALGRYPPGDGVQEELADLLVEAAINGTGMDRKAFTQSMIDAMKNTLVNLPWSSDNMPLSQRLHKLNGVARQALDEEIHTAMRKGTTWQTLSRQIYDGYGHGGKLRRAEDIPGYLKQLQQAARRVIGDDPEAMQAYNALLRQVSRLKTPGLRAGYAKLLEAAKYGTAAAEARAIHTALEERSRYYAERIARTELARAWADGFYARTLGDSDVIAYQWRLSSNHPVHDVCDFHAKADLYGLGPGIYPKNRMPPMPAHPHCRCHLVEVFEGELDGKAQDDKLHERGQAYLESLTPAEQTRLLGVEGREKWRDGGAWEQHLVGWAGHENPRSRLHGIINLLPNLENAVIPEAKIFRYALGYNQSNGGLLIEAIRESLPRFKSVVKEQDQYGERYNVVLRLMGVNGREANVLTAWIIRPEEDFPRLTTVYVTEKEAIRFEDQ